MRRHRKDRCQIRRAHCGGRHVGTLFGKPKSQVVKHMAHCIIDPCQPPCLLEYALPAIQHSNSTSKSAVFGNTALENANMRFMEHAQAGKIIPIGRVEHRRIESGQSASLFAKQKGSTHSAGGAAPLRTSKDITRTRQHRFLFFAILWTTLRSFAQNAMPVSIQRLRTSLTGIDRCQGNFTFANFAG